MVLLMVVLCFSRVTLVGAVELVLRNTIGWFTEASRCFYYLEGSGTLLMVLHCR